MNLAIFSGLLTYVGLKTPAKRSHLAPCLRWSPFMLLFLAATLSMVDLSRHVFLDSGMFIEQLHMFEDDGSLTAAGRLWQISSWVGGVLQFLALIWFVMPAR